MLVSFGSTVFTLLGLENATGVPKLVGADNELGYPSSAFSAVLFVIILTVTVAQLAGSSISPAWWRALCTALAIGVVFQTWAAYLNLSWFLAAQLLLMLLVFAFALLRLKSSGPALGLGIILAVASAVGFFAAFRLTVEKVATLTAPDIAPSCNVSVLVQCGKNLVSWQGSLLGFPNPLLGIMGWMALFMIAVLIIGGVTLPRWFWITQSIGITAALAFSIWLIIQSIFVLGTLCPWCMVTWAMVIPIFWLITLHTLKSGYFSSSQVVKRAAAAAYGFVPLITLLCFVAVAALAQVRLDLINHL